MTDKEKASRYDSLMMAIDFTKKSLAARIDEEEKDRKNPSTARQIASLLLGRIAVEQEMIELLERWKGQEG